VRDVDRPTAVAEALLDGIRSRRPRASTSDGAPASVLEVGIGDRTGVAAALHDRGVAVTAIDLRERAVPDGVAFRTADVTDPDERFSDAIDGVYALRLPPELHRPVAELGERLDVPAVFTTLGGDPPTVPVRPEQLTCGETLFWIDR